MVSGERNTDPRPLRHQGRPTSPASTRRDVDSRSPTSRTTSMATIAGGIVGISAEQGREGRRQDRLEHHRWPASVACPTSTRTIRLQPATSTFHRHTRPASAWHRTPINPPNCCAPACQLNSDWTDSILDRSALRLQELNAGQDPVTAAASRQFTVCTDATSTPARPTPRLLDRQRPSVCSARTLSARPTRCQHRYLWRLVAGAPEA